MTQLREGEREGEREGSNESFIGILRFCLLVVPTPRSQASCGKSLLVHDAHRIHSLLQLQRVSLLSQYNWKLLRDHRSGNLHGILGFDFLVKYANGLREVVSIPHIHGHWYSWFLHCVFVHDDSHLIGLTSRVRSCGETSKGHFRSGGPVALRSRFDLSFSRLSRLSRLSPSLSVALGLSRLSSRLTPAIDCWLFRLLSAQVHTLNISN